MLYTWVSNRVAAPYRLQPQLHLQLRPQLMCTPTPELQHTLLQPWSQPQPNPAQLMRRLQHNTAQLICNEAQHSTPTSCPSHQYNAFVMLATPCCTHWTRAAVCIGCTAACCRDTLKTLPLQVPHQVLLCRLLLPAAHLLVCSLS